MQLATISELYDLAEQIGYCRPQDVREALEALLAELKRGTTFSSGDGFYYFWLNNGIVCHDGGRINRRNAKSFADGLQSYVWQRKQLAEVLGEIIVGNDPETALWACGLKG